MDLYSAIDTSTCYYLFVPQEFWPLLTGLKWLHSGAVGLEHLLTPALVTSPVLLTNARGVYSQSLAECVPGTAAAACNCVLHS